MTGVVVFFVALLRFSLALSFSVSPLPSPLSSSRRAPLPLLTTLSLLVPLPPTLPTVPLLLLSFFLPGSPHEGTELTSDFKLTKDAVLPDGLTEGTSDGAALPGGLTEGESDGAAQI